MDQEPQDAYRAYVTYCYSQPVVARILTLEQFAEDEERVEHYKAAAAAAKEALGE